MICSGHIMKVVRSRLANIVYREIYSMKPVESIQDAAMNQSLKYHDATVRPTPISSSSVKAWFERSIECPTQPIHLSTILATIDLPLRLTVTFRPQYGFPLD